MIKLYSPTGTAPPLLLLFITSPSTPTPSPTPTPTPSLNTSIRTYLRTYSTHHNGIELPLFVDAQAKQAIREGPGRVRPGHPRSLAKHCQGRGREIGGRSEATLRHSCGGPQAH